MPASGDSVPIPTSANKRDKPLSFGPVAISVHSLISVMGFGGIWVFISSELIGLILPMWLGLFITSPLIIFGCMIAFLTKDKFPYEYYLANKLIYFIDGEYYTLRVADYEEITSGKSEKQEGYY